MRVLRSLVIALAAVAGAGVAAPAMAKTNPPCGVSGVTSASIGNYNPFSGSGFNSVPVTLNLTRISNGGDKTQQVDFYVVRPAGAQYAGFDVLDPNNGNQSVMHLLGTQALDLPSPPATGTVYYNFGGAAQPDTVPFPLLVTVPSGLDLTAGQPLQFDIEYICTGTGQLDDVKTAQTLSQAITLQVNVLSVLIAHWAGPDLAFGDITTKTTGWQTPKGYIQVRSTGPYNVSIVSQNDTVGQPFHMMWGASTAAADTVKYSVSFNGQTLDSLNKTYSTTCVRGGVSDPGTSLGLQATLEEGGAGKTPSATSIYQDNLIVTFTPQVAPPAGNTCF